VNNGKLERRGEGFVSVLCIGWSLGSIGSYVRVVDNPHWGLFFPSNQNGLFFGKS